MKDPVRAIMFLIALILPAVIGAIGTCAEDRSEKPRGKKETAKAILRGYPYKLGLSLTTQLPYEEWEILYREKLEQALVEFGKNSSFRRGLSYGCGRLENDTMSKTC
jgi:hypothetical protein